MQASHAGAPSGLVLLLVHLPVRRQKVLYLQVTLMSLNLALHVLEQ